MTGIHRASPQQTPEIKIPLREKKYARTKLSLLDACIHHLEKTETSFESLSVRALCETAEVSEATFFNYFSKKADLLDYYLLLWNLELTWQSQHTNKKGFAAISEIFTHIAQRFQKKPQLMKEIIAYQALQTRPAATQELSPAERTKALGQLNGIVDLKAIALDRLWLNAIEQAIKNNELPQNIHIPTLIFQLASIYYGTPLALGLKGFSRMNASYQQQLNICRMGMVAASSKKTV